MLILKLQKRRNGSRGGRRLGGQGRVGLGVGSGVREEAFLVILVRESDIVASVGAMVDWDDDANEDLSTLRDDGRLITVIRSLPCC